MYSKQTTSIWIGIVVVVFLVVGAYYFGAANKNPTQPVSAEATQNIPAPVVTQEQPPVKQTAQQPTTNTETNTETKTVPSTSNTDESLACSNQAKILFNTHSSAIPRSMDDGTFTYKNHFNSTDGKCFSVETYSSNSSFGQSLWDVYENNNIANYNLDNANSPSGQCTMNGVPGCTKTQFDTFLNSEMESTTY